VASPGLDADNLFRSESGNAGANLSRAVSADIHFGSILDAVPFWGVYTVAASGRLPFLCNDGTGLGGSPYYGSRGRKVIPPHTPVVIAAFPGSQRGTIVAVMPEMTTGGRLTPIPGYVFMGSGPTGMAAPLYDHISNHAEAAGAIDYNAGAPVDQLPGDQACFSPLDVGWMVSMSMAMLRAQDDCAVELYHFDSLLRLHGHNFERFTGASELREFDDEGEPHVVRHYAKFPYELAGTTRPVDPFRTGNDSDGSFEAPKEPKVGGQTGAWRMLEAMGYLGDLKRVQVQRPSDRFAGDPAAFGGFTHGDGSMPAALSDVYQGSDGTIALSSAKQVIFRKTAMIPALVQNRLPDDDRDGDGARNYKAAGQFGDGPDPTKSKEFLWPDDLQAGARVEYLNDYLAHFFMWYSLLTFRDHKKDWVVGSVPADSRGFDGVDAGINKDAVDALRFSFWGGMPTMKRINVDAVKGEVSYYAGSSVHALLDDGSIYMEDAWGSSIFMGYGNIMIRPVGNLFVQTGQRTVVWNGLDHIVRSLGCIDMTATKGDLRMSVGRNIQALAGNDARNGGYGGILLESRATTKAKDFNAVGEDVRDSGITLMARRSSVSAYGDDVYLGTSGETKGGSPGIVLDASRGDRGIYETGKTVVRSAARDYLDYFSASNKISYKSPEIAYTQAKTTVVEGSLMVVGGEGGVGNIAAGGRITSDEMIMAKRDIVSAYGTVLGDFVYGKKGVAYYSPAETPTMVAPSTTDPLENLRNHLEKGTYNIKPELDKLKSSQRQAAETVEKSVRTENHPGGETLLRNIGVSLRTVVDYNVGDFIVAETSWQRRFEADLTPWEEIPVKAQGGVGLDTYPFPGLSYYVGNIGLYKGGNKLIDPETGNPVPPGSDYEDAGAEAGNDTKGFNQYGVFRNKYL
jgi:hypothetical protein